MSEAYFQHSKDYIKKLYLQDTPVKKLLQIFDVQQSTLYSWIKREKWDEEKKARQSKSARTPEILKEMIEDMIADLHKRSKENKLPPDEFASISDALAKITKSLKSLYRDHDYLDVFIKMFTEFVTYIDDSSHKLPEDFRNRLSELSKGFSQHLINKYSAKNFR